MTVKAPPRQKPSSADEVARVMRIMRLLLEGVRSDGLPLPSLDRYLDVADRIAARTQD